MTERDRERDRLRLFERLLLERSLEALLPLELLEAERERLRE